mgnify:CR=1 FL=1
MRNRFVLLFLMIAFLFGCVNQPNNKQTITIATLKGPSAMGMIRMIDSLANAPNADIKIKILNEPLQVRKMVIDGSADFAILPTTMAAILYNKGLDYKLMAIPVWGTLYLFGSDTTISIWNDLKGKTINVMAKGMTPDVLFCYLLSANGINPNKDVTLDYSFPTHIDLANAVAAEQASLGVISEPLVSMVIQRNPSVAPIFDLNSEWQKIQSVPIAQTALIVKSSLVENNADLAGKVASSYCYSSQWVNANPDSAAALIVKYGILPNAEVAMNAIPRSNLKYVDAKAITDDVNRYLKVFYQMNADIIGGKLPDENFVY